MTREEAITLIKSAQLMLINPTTNEPISDLHMALEMAIQALSQEPRDDAISREAVRKCFYGFVKMDKDTLPYVEEYLKTVMRRINEFPSV